MRTAKSIVFWFGAGSIILFLASCIQLPGKIHPSLPAGENYVRLPKPIELRTGKSFDCGAESLDGVMQYYGQRVEFQQLSDSLYSPGVPGTFPQKLIQSARAQGYEVRNVEGSYESLRQSIDAGIPAIILVRAREDANHYLLASAYQPDKEQICFEFYRGWKWLIPRDELEEIWKPCGHLQLNFVLSPISARLSNARTLESKGETEQALKIYQEILAKEPQQARARLGAGNCYAMNGQFKLARENYLIALDNGLKDPELFNNLADISLMQGMEDTRAAEWAQLAVSEYEGLVNSQQSPLSRKIAERKLALALGTLGSAQQTRGEDQLACASYKRSLELLGENEPELRSRRLAQIAACEKPKP